MRLVEEQPQVEAVQIHHYRLLLASTPVVVPRELEISVLVEPLLLAASGNVIQDVDLRGYFAVVRNQLYLADVDHAVKLKGNFLGVGTEAARLPALRSRKEQGRDWVFLLF